MKIILKLQDSLSIQESKNGLLLSKLNSSISPKDFIKLLSKADNKVNPRNAKLGSISKAIQETLEFSPSLFWLKSKGILLATKNLRKLDRNRVEITLDDVEFEGVMDGGHNTFAIASYIIEKLFNKKVKNWKECKDYWEENYTEIVTDFNSNSEKFQFSIPIEILFPKDEDGALDQYYDFIAEICSARNNLKKS